MKKILGIVLLIGIVATVNGQANRTDVLQNLEQGQSQVQSGNVTATMKSASRLFGEKDDLTTVIMIIPSGSVVNILGSDSTYYKVTFEDSEGYILKRHAVIDKAVQTNQQVVQYQQPQVQNQQEAQPQVSRFTYLENKYGTSMAARLNSGKIWKGMNSEMVKDSWGTAEKVNRVISGNIIKEEWIFKTTWLYFENSILTEWGPVRQ